LIEDGLLRELAATPRRLAHLAEDNSAERMAAARPGVSSARRVIAELLDAECFGFRLRLERMLSEERPVLSAFRAASGREREGEPVRELIRAFALHRQASLSLVAALDDSGARREAVLPDGEVLTIAGLVERWVRNDREMVALAQAAVRAAGGQV
jgi:hypothetical protein